jgi:hypothetical protein
MLPADLAGSRGRRPSKYAESEDHLGHRSEPFDLELRVVDKGKRFNGVGLAESATLGGWETGRERLSSTAFPRGSQNIRSIVRPGKGAKTVSDEKPIGIKLRQRLRLPWWSC